MSILEQRYQAVPAVLTGDSVVEIAAKVGSRGQSAADALAERPLLLRLLVSIPPLDGRFADASSSVGLGLPTVTRRIP
jgi:hypothetical protein